MLASPTAITRAAETEVVTLIADPQLRELAEEMIAIARQGGTGDAATLLMRLDEATAARVAARLVGGEGTTEEQGDAEAEATMMKLVDDCVAALRERAARQDRQALLRRIRAAEGEGNVAAVVEAQRELEHSKRGGVRP